MKINALVKSCMTVTVAALVLGVYASNSYGQETSTTDDTVAPANPVPPAAYVNAGKGYEIGGNIVLATPGGSDFSGNHNVALGTHALRNNTTGFYNTASGTWALHSNTTGNSNMASGTGALDSNTTGDGNTASGVVALYDNTMGSQNTASGEGAMDRNTTGSYDTASGWGALSGNMTGLYNTASGYLACDNLLTGSNVICIGANSGPAGDIPGPATYIANVYGALTTGSGNPVVCIDSTGLLGTTGCATSSLPAAQQAVIEHQQVQIETLQRQNQELQQRMSRLEALIAKK
jgi:hypothetical protein